MKKRRDRREGPAHEDRGRGRQDWLRDRQRAARQQGNRRELPENDLSKASFEVIVDVGPSSTSKRAGTVRALTGMMTLPQDPETLDADQPGHDEPRR